MRLPKGIFINCLLMIAVFLLSIIFAELIFRLCANLDFIKYPRPEYNNTIHRYSKNKELIYELKPNFSSSDSLYKINKYGMRDYEYPLAKSGNTIRICLLGDSVSFGKDLSLDQTYEDKLEKKLNHSKNVNIFEVLNFSVSGYNSYQEEILLKENVIKFNPDMVIVGFCLNDDSYTDGFREFNKEFSPYSLGARLHSKLVSYLLSKYERIMFEKMSNMAKVKSFFSQLFVLSKEKDFDVLILIFPYLFDNIETYEYKQKHKDVENIAKQYNFEIIDFMERWKTMKHRERKKLYSDVVHLSPLGMDNVADKVFTYLAEKYKITK